MGAGYPYRHFYAGRGGQLLRHSGAEWVGEIDAAGDSERVHVAEQRGGQYRRAGVWEGGPGGDSLDNRADRAFAEPDVRPGYVRSRGRRHRPVRDGPAPDPSECFAGSVAARGAVRCKRGFAVADICATLAVAE